MTPTPEMPKADDTGMIEPHASPHGVFAEVRSWIVDPESDLTAIERYAQQQRERAEKAEASLERALGPCSERRTTMTPSPNGPPLYTPPPPPPSRPSNISSTTRTQPPPNNDASTVLPNLWELSEEGKELWWCPHMYLEKSGPLPKHFVAMLRIWGGYATQIDSSIALDIVTAEAERWLAEDTWTIERSFGNRVRYMYDSCGLGSSAECTTLTEALKYAMDNT